MDFDTSRKIAAKAEEFDMNWEYTGSYSSSDMETAFTAGAKEAYDIMKEREDKLLSALDAAYNQIKLVPNYSKNQDLVEALQAIDDARKENLAAQGFEE